MKLERQVVLDQRIVDRDKLIDRLYCRRQVNRPGDGGRHRRSGQRGLRATDRADWSERTVDGHDVLLAIMRSEAGGEHRLRHLTLELIRQSDARNQRYHRPAFWSIGCDQTN